MAITHYPPNLVFLGGGDRVEINNWAAKAAITPGMLVERDTTTAVTRWKAHATAGGGGERAVATEALMLNKGVDDAYATGDLVEVTIARAGHSFWMIIGSGVNVVAGDGLESAGNGKLRKLASGVEMFKALEAKNVTADTRIRVEAI